MDERAPLVSVIVRSLGRPTLARSLASLAAQCHRPLEVVIVNAGTGLILHPPQASGIRWRVIGGGPYDRPRAANVGLAAAHGDWIAFLDDDDAYLPDHIETLLRAVRGSDGALVAYSATQCLDEQGRVAMTIGSGFDRLKLFSLNYIQIGAALFARSLVGQGCRFDEEFECMQDWDFWLQLAQRTRFVHTGTATNLWNAFCGGSGCGMGANTDTGLQAYYHALLTRKWKPAGDALHRKVEHHNRLAREAARRGLAANADAHMAIAERLLHGAPRSPSSSASKKPRSAVKIRSEGIAG